RFPFYRSFFGLILAAICDGKDWRQETLTDCKQELRRLLARSPAMSPLKYTEYIDGCGHCSVSAHLRIGFGSDRCHADVRALRHRPRAQHLVQNLESGIFTKGRQRDTV